MNLIGFCYATGVSYCDKDIDLHNGYYKEIAYVWENGFIDWKVNKDKYDLDELLPIYKCSADHINKVNEKKKILAEQKEKLLKLEEGTFSHYHTNRYIQQLQIILDDLEKYKTTQVIHY